MVLPISVIAADSADRGDLMGHLRWMGFAPRVCATMARAGSDPVVVCIRDRDDMYLLAGLAGYCARAHHRVVVITRTPGLVRQVAAAERADALDVLVPPLLLGQLGDALRGPVGATP